MPEPWSLDVSNTFSLRMVACALLLALVQRAWQPVVRQALEQALEEVAALEVAVEAPPPGPRRTRNSIRSSTQIHIQTRILKHPPIRCRLCEAQIAVVLQGLWHSWSTLVQCPLQVVVPHTGSGANLRTRARMPMP